MRNSKILRKLRAGKPTLLTTVGLGPSPLAVEIAGRAGVDGVWIETEHRPTTQREVANMINAARIVDDTHWTAEWRIPFASLGIDPAKQKRFQFNISVRKMAEPLWIMWQGTGAHTWDVRTAGTLELGR